MRTMTGRASIVPPRTDFFTRYITAFMVVMVVMLVALVLPTYGKQITVSKDDTGDYHAIQEAIDAASTGDLVFVKPGTYEEHIDFKDRITLEGSGADKTTIKYAGDSQVITAKNISNGAIRGFAIEYAGTEDNFAMVLISSSLTVSHNTITGATYSGIVVGNSSSVPIIEHNIIRDNTQAGIHIYASAKGTIRDNQIYGNGYQGIQVKEESDPVIHNNIIRDNTNSGIFVYASAKGTIRDNQIYGNGYHGITVKEESDPVIANNTIVANQQNGVWAYDKARPVVRNNIIVLNGDGIDVNYSDYSDGEPVVSYNNVWGNKGGNYEGMSKPATDISVDPQFVDEDRHDYRLRPTSPCLGAGLNGVDLGARPYVPSNKPPTAIFSKSPPEPECNALVRFDASGSEDPDGKIIQYAWDWDNDGRWDVMSSNESHKFAFTTSGPHSVTLQVTDDEGATDSITHTVEVGENQPPTNQAPTASFDFSPSSPSPVDIVKFSDTSSDPDGQIVEWQWEFGDGYASYVSNPYHQYQSPGTYTVTLSVTDNNGATNSSSQTITVIDVVLVPPIPSFTLSASRVLIDQVVTLDPSASSDPDGTIVNCEWDLGDGTRSEGKVVTHTYATAGTYTVKLTVTDNDGQSVSIDKEVKVFLHGGTGGPA